MPPFIWLCLDLRKHNHYSHLYSVVETAKYSKPRLSKYSKAIHH